MSLKRVTHQSTGLVEDVLQVVGQQGQFAKFGKHFALS
ncbi:hypothetical protein J2W17_002133 [Pseudomonas lini]|nr:hypothetical protein [Pseudomonas lini]